MSAAAKRKRSTKTGEKEIRSPNEAESSLVTAVFGDDKLLSKAGSELEQFDQVLKVQKTDDTDAAAAWHDDDDENVSINVAAVARLRKLRQSDDEKVVSATDLSARLRKQ